MANSKIQTRGYMTLNGVKYQLSDYFDSITTSLGTTAKHISVLSPDGSSPTILTNKEPTISFSNPLVDKATYVKLFGLLYSSLNPTIVIQTFVIGEGGDKSPSGPAFTFTNCKAAGKTVSMQPNDAIKDSYVIIAEDAIEL
jgi:hypothetical protein